ncbi:MAG: hypothetical protein M3540_11655 [Actinomycetota bacterium]|nr:hypothetical protein [Actinomycetota bacterium]
MAAPFTRVVEPRAEDPVEVLDPGREICVADLHDQMEVRREQAIRVADPVVAIQRPVKKPQVNASQFVVGKHSQAADAAGRDVVDAVRLLDA